MLDPGWMVERTAKQLVDKLEQARRQQVPTGRTSGRRLLRLWPRRLILPTAFCPYHRLVLISCGFSIVFGSVLSISIYYVVLLLAAGSEVMAAGDMDWLNQYRYGAWGSHARLGEGWDGMHSTRSLDSDLVVSFDNDLGGKSSPFVAACTIQCCQLTLRVDGWLTLHRTWLHISKFQRNLSPSPTALRTSPQVLRDAQRDSVGSVNAYVYAFGPPHVLSRDPLKAWKGQGRPVLDKPC